MAPRGDLSDSRFVTAAGVRVHYKEVGEGYPVICLHGAGPGANSESNFRRNVGALSERFRAVLVDMPQFGKSEKIPIEEGRLDFNSRVIDAFMTETGIERAHYIGNSMGGQVALKLAIDKPGRVDRLVVIGPGAINNPIFVPSPLEGIKLIADYYKGGGRPATSCASSLRRSSTTPRSSPTKSSRSASRRRSSRTTSNSSPSARAVTGRRTCTPTSARSSPRR